MIQWIGGRDEDLSIVSGFDRLLYDSFKNALERGQTKAWQQIIYFVQKEFIHAFSNDSGVVMQQLNWLPSAIYNLSSGNQEASSTIAKQFGSFFKTLSWTLKSKDIQINTVGEHPVRFQMFFKMLMNFYHYAIHHKEEMVVHEILNDFKSIAEDDYNFDTRIEIQRMIGATQAEKKTVRDQASKKHQLMITRRQAALTLLAWLTFLFFMDKLTAERFIFLLRELDLRYLFFEDLLADIDYIRTNEAKGYLGIDFWDYMERPTGQIYSPPNAYDWILYGPCLLLLREQPPNFSPQVIIDDREHGFLLDGMKQKLQVFKSQLDKISGILGWDVVTATDGGRSREEELQRVFQEREEQILAMFQVIKTLHEEEENKQIVAQPLDMTMVNSFRETLYQKWLANCFSYQLFKDKGVLETVKTDEGLDLHGQSILLEHQKMMFVQGEQQTIYGSEDLGAAIGRGVDERFIHDITRVAPQQRNKSDQDFESVCAGLDASIATIRVNGFFADMIILPSMLFYNSDLVSSDKYKRLNLTEKSFQIGLYDGIPVMRLFAQALNSKAIVTSFSHALHLSVWEDQTLYERMLHLELRELTQEEIDTNYKNDQAKWTTSSDGIKLTEGQAKLRLATSLMLEMWARGKFKIIEPKAITWCRFSPSATEKNKTAAG